MYDTHETLARTHQKIQDRFVAQSIATELKEWATAELHAIQTDLDLVIRGREGYEDFLLTFIARERERFQADTADGTPYDDVREVPLCTCDDLGCALKRGQVPLRVREADSIDRGIRLFKQEHNGDPIVLDYESDPRGARQEWSGKRADVWRVLRRVETYLIMERDEPPTDDELDGAATAGGDRAEAD